jgi:hypothetical protein
LNLIIFRQISKGLHRNHTPITFDSSVMFNFAPNLSYFG